MFLRCLCSSSVSSSLVGLVSGTFQKGVQHLSKNTKIQSNPSQHRTGPWGAWVARTSLRQQRHHCRHSATPTLPSLLTRCCHLKQSLLLCHPCWSQTWTQNLLQVSFFFFSLIRLYICIFTSVSCVCGLVRVCVGLCVRVCVCVGMCVWVGGWNKLHNGIIHIQNQQTGIAVKVS